METHRDTDMLSATIAMMIIIYVSAIIAVIIIMAILLWIMAISERFPSRFAERGDENVEMGEIGATNSRTTSISKCK